MNPTTKPLLIGNEQALFYLQKLSNKAKKEFISGSYVLAGHDEIQKTIASHWLINSLICKVDTVTPCGQCQACHSFGQGMYPDYYEINLESDKQNISIEQVKALLIKIGLKSFTGSYRFVLINNAESLSLGAANALLKTLEEPGSGIMILLLTNDISQLPATIISRSNIVYFKPVAVSVIQRHLSGLGLDFEKANLIARLSSGKVGLSNFYYANDDIVAARLKIAYDFITQLEGDLNSRLEYGKNYLTTKKLKDNSVDAKDIVFVWQAVMRDMALLYYNQGDLIQHEVYLVELSHLIKKYNPKRLTKALELLAQTIKYLQSNVNKQLALENVLINI